jgi:hypothetical protein
VTLSGWWLDKFEYVDELKCLGNLRRRTEHRCHGQESMSDEASCPPALPRIPLPRPNNRIGVKPGLTAHRRRVLTVAQGAAGPATLRLQYDPATRAQVPKGSWRSSPHCNSVETVGGGGLVVLRGRRRRKSIRTVTRKDGNLRSAGQHTVTEERPANEFSHRDNKTTSLDCS